MEVTSVKKASYDTSTSSHPLDINSLQLLDVIMRKPGNIMYTAIIGKSIINYL